MKRYMIQIKDLGNRKFENILKHLKDAGIHMDNFEFLRHSKKGDVGIQLNEVSRGEVVGFKFMFLGMLLSMCVYFSVLWSQAFDWSLFFKAPNLWIFSFVILASGFVCLTFGYIMGRRTLVHRIEYAPKKSAQEEFIMTLSAKPDKIERLREIFKRSSVDHFKISEFPQKLGTGLAL